MNGIAIVTLRNPSEDLIKELRESHESGHSLPLLGRWVHVVALDIETHMDDSGSETALTVYCQEAKEDE